MKTLTIATLSAAVALAVPAGTADGTTFHVNGACGNNGWTGTSSDCTPPHGPKRTIQAAIEAAAHGDEILVWPDTYQERINLLGKAVIVHSQAGPEMTIIDGQRTGTVVTCVNGEGPGTVVEGFTVTGGLASLGGGMYNGGSSPTVRDCVFTDNEGEIGAAMRNQHGSSPLIERCSFIGNFATHAGGGMINSEGQPVIRDCLFLQNTAETFGAVVNLNLEEGSPAFVNCQFLQNESLSVFAVTGDGGGADWVNCVFSRNTNMANPSGQVGTLHGVEGETLVANCTFSDNIGAGLTEDYYSMLLVRNSIIWGHTVTSIQGSPTVTYSDVEGGWSGAGNIDEDPLFVQAGTDNVRLSVGSPCVDAGDNDSIPPGIDTDIDGNPRILDGVVDMGAYEGEFDGEPAAAGDSDFDQGEFTILIPNGDTLDPLQSAAAVVVNTSGPDDATFVLEEYDGDVHPGADGYSELSCVLGVETSLENGQYHATLFIPFDAAAVGGVNPVEINLTCYDPTVGNWALAVAGNAVNSPGHDGPVGDRMLSLDGGPWSVSNELGDYGVHWDPALQQGFAWANVDHETDFGVGGALCPADCLQTPDGSVTIEDFLALLRRWGEASVGAPCDIDFDGMIDVEDFLALLDSWGVCPQAALPAAAGASGRAGFSLPAQARVRSADIDGDGRVGHSDLETVQMSWGPCDPDCDADLNTDGRVDTRDVLMLLADWR